LLSAAAATHHYDVRATNLHACVLPLAPIEWYTMDKLEALRAEAKTAYQGAHYQRALSLYDAALALPGKHHRSLRCAGGTMR
jgi:hypothetical protein